MSDPEHGSGGLPVLLRILDGQIRRLDQELVQRWGTIPEFSASLTIPGIGPFTAIQLILELRKIQRFPSAKHLASYVGLLHRRDGRLESVRLA